MIKMSNKKFDVLALIKEIQESPDEKSRNKIIDNLNEEEVTSIRKHYAQRTYGVVPTKADEKAPTKHFTALAITNLYEKFQTQLLATGLVSFLYRMTEEYRPEMNPSDTTQEFIDEFEKLVLQKNKLISVIQEQKQNIDLFKKDLSEKNNENDKLTKLIKEGKKQFLPRAKELTKERQALQDKLSTAIDKLNTSNLAFAGISKKMTTSFNNESKKSIHNFVDYYFQYDPAIHTRSGTDNRFEPSKPVPNVPPHILRKPVMPLYGKKMTIPDPPKELFHTFNTYITTNFDSLYATTYKLYHETPAIEFMGTIVKTGMTQQEMETFKKVEADTLPYQVRYVEEGRPFVLEKFSKNRDKLEYYNENMDLLRAIYDKIEQDEKMGEELLKNRVEREKKKNIEEAGEHAETFKKHITNNPSGVSQYVTQGGKILKEKEVQHLPIHVASKDEITTKTVQLEASEPEKADVLGFKSTGGGGISQVVDRSKEGPVGAPMAVSLVSAKSKHK